MRGGASSSINPRASITMGVSPFRLLVLLTGLGMGSTTVVAEPSDLLEAAKRADMVAVRALLDQGVAVDAIEGDGTTALHWASYHDEIATVQHLLTVGADVNAVTDLGVTPLWTASQNGSGELVSILLTAGANPNLALLAGETPLMVAARSGALEVMELLVAHGAALEARGSRGQTALMWAVAQGHSPVVDRLLSQGADPHGRSDVWVEVMGVPPHAQPEYNRDIPQGGNTALMFAARVGSVASARHLIAAGANVDDMDGWGVSATTMAAHAGFGELVDLLLEAGADADAAEAGFAAIHAAVMRQDVSMVKALLHHGADPNAVLHTWTPTRRASRDFHFAPPLVGATPFWLAARFTAPAIMRLLAEYGADPLTVHNAAYKSPADLQPLKEATTALMAAVGMGGGRRMRAWAQQNPSDAEQLTLESVQLAVELGIDINATDLEGRTALDGARMARWRSVASYLEAHGARPSGQ